MMARIRNIACIVATVIGMCLLGSSPAQADDPNLPPYPFPIPDLGSCPALTPQVFKYPNGVLAPQGCVAALQQSLEAVGFTELSTTGDYEANTYGSVWNFQLAHSIDLGLSPTGSADAATIAALDKIANSPAALSPGRNGAEADGSVKARPPLPAPIGVLQLQTNAERSADELAHDCEAVCDEDAAE